MKVDLFSTLHGYARETCSLMFWVDMESIFETTMKLMANFSLNFSAAGKFYKALDASLDHSVRFVKGYWHVKTWNDVLLDLYIVIAHTCLS